MEIHKPEMKTNAIISSLRVKFGEKSWEDTFRLVRRCMDKSRVDSKPHEAMFSCLERLHGALKVSSVNAMMSRLETIARQRGMGFHFTDSTCYLTADLFYLEVVLLPGGGVEEVKVALHGDALMSSEPLLELLRSKKFEEFSLKLESLCTLYNIPGDNEMKIKLLTSLQYLGKDLQKLYHLPRALHNCDPHIDKILNGRVGCLIEGKEDRPLTIQFYISPSDILKTSHSTSSVTEQDIQSAHVIVCSSEMTYTLQMASVITVPPQLDPQGNPVFSPLSEVACDSWPACFLLRLQPPLSMFSSFVHRLSQITEVPMPEGDQQGAAFHTVLMGSSLGADKGEEDSFDEQDVIFTVPLPGEVHRYVLPWAAWDDPGLRGMLVDRVPFTHPAHVPALLEVLRHQCAINTLLTSLAPSPPTGPEIPGLVHDLNFEVLPQSNTSFSVTFPQPNVDCLAVLLVNVADCRHVTCSLFGAGDSIMEEYTSTVMTRCMSVPVTMRALRAKMARPTASSPLPVSAETDGAPVRPQYGPAPVPNAPGTPEDHTLLGTDSVAMATPEPGPPACLPPAGCPMGTVGAYPHESSIGHVC